MVSLEDRMRENRRVLAEITETKRTATRELHEFVDVVRAAQQPIQALRKAVTWLGILGPLIILALGFVGGLAAGLLLRQPPT